MTIAADRLWRGEAPYRGEIAFVDLDAAAECPDDIVLPPCPVVGIGARDHPLASVLDAVIEPPFSAQAVASQVLAQPQAAAVVVQLLRLLPDLAIEDALTAESLAYGLLQGSEPHRRWLAGLGRPAAQQVAAGVRAERSGGCLTLVLDRPESGNAIDRAMRDALYDGFAVAALDPTIETVRLSAEGRTFSLGAELAEFGTTLDPAVAHSIRVQTLPARMIARCADRLEVRIQGACVGSGLEMAAWARRVVAVSDAWFQLPELAMGILPGAGGCVSLSRRLGRQRTALLILSGKRIGARLAREWGLVDEIVEKSS